MIALRLIVSGRVQGVGYRYFAVREATALGITGFVRNMDNGDEVEVVACGQEPELNEFLDRLKRGPRGAIVTGISAQPMESSVRYPDFTIRY